MGKAQRALIVAACLCLGAAIGPIAVYATVSSTPPVAVGTANSDGANPEIAAAMTECVDDPEDIQEEAGKPCLQEIFYKLIREGTVPLYYDTIELLYNDHAAMRLHCHPAAHNASYTLSEERYLPAEEVAEKTAFPSKIGDGCLYGVAHGFYDYLAINQDEIPEWDMLVKTCEQAKENTDGRPFDYQACAEGVGHLAWNSTLNTIEGSKKCLSFSDERAVAFCTLSVFMEEFVPREEITIFTPKKPLADDEWVDLCNELNDIAASLARGCAAGASYARSRHEPIVDTYLDVAKTTVGTEENIEGVSFLVQDSIDFCELFRPMGDDDSRACVVAYLTSLPRNAINQDAVLERFCDRKGGLDADLCQEIRSLE